MPPPPCASFCHCHGPPSVGSKLNWQSLHSPIHPSTHPGCRWDSIMCHCGALHYKRTSVRTPRLVDWMFSHLLLALLTTFLGAIENIHGRAGEKGRGERGERREERGERKGESMGVGVCARACIFGHWPCLLSCVVRFIVPVGEKITRKGGKESTDEAEKRNTWKISRAERGASAAEAFPYILPNTAIRMRKSDSQTESCGTRSGGSFPGTRATASPASSSWRLSGLRIILRSKRQCRVGVTGSSGSSGPSATLPIRGMSPLITRKCIGSSPGS